jgi:Ca2+-binding RTX toxin-like protein
LAFSTVTGSNGVTSLVGTTGVDTATVVTLDSNVFVGGNTGDDILTTNLGTGGNNLSAYTVRMGGGNDTLTLGDTVLNSTISLDGETLANDGNDILVGGANLVINSEIVGRGGNDSITNVQLNGSVVNGNTGDDTITINASSTSTVYGGQGTDTITTTNNTANSAVLINGNKGSDTITLGAASYTGSVYGGNGNDTINAAAVDADQNGTALGATATGVFLSGDLGNDNITGSTGVDTINGGDGTDTIAAGTGADTINGGAGNDAITGNAGADTITGGTGNDRFILAALTDATLTSATSNTGFDTITDFAANSGTTAAAINGDRIQLGGAVGAVGAASSRAGTTSLAADLAAEVAFAGAVRDVDLVTITGAVAWAGNYVVVNGAADNTFDFAADAVIKVNTLAGIGAQTFNLV